MLVESRKVSDSIVETVHMIRPNHLNSAGRLFGGMLMQWMDEIAGIVAKRHTRMNVITASIDNLRFLKGAYQRDIVIIIGKITYVGKTSMEVKVDSYVEHPETGERTLINRAYFTMVALDVNDRPTLVPRLELTTDEEREEWEKAEKRREMRKMRKRKDFDFLPHFFFIYVVTIRTILSICSFSSVVFPSFKISRIREISSDVNWIPFLLAEAISAIMTVAREFPFFPEVCVAAVLISSSLTWVNGFHCRMIHPFVHIPQILS